MISPVLFSIFINDIPIHRDKTNKAYCLLFADDLVTLGCYKKPGHILQLIDRYLKDMEIWLNNWRLKMSAHKCSYSIFTKANASENIELKLFESLIPYEKHPRFLGIKFDDKLTFVPHIEELKTKCIKRLNIIKIISHKSWMLDDSTLMSTYYALVRSVIDYVFFAIGIIAESNIMILQRIQNRALKTIFKPPPLTNLAKLEVEKGVANVKNRLLTLLINFTERALKHNNPLIKRLRDEYKRGFEGRTVKMASQTALFCLENSI